MLKIAYGAVLHKLHTNQVSDKIGCDKCVTVPSNIHKAVLFAEIELTGSARGTTNP